MHGGEMRKLSLIVAAGAFLVPAISQAKPLNDLLMEKGVIADDAGQSGQLSYKNGTRLTFGNDFDAQLNLLLQTRLEHHDRDGGPDTTGFNVERARFILGGNMLEDEWSYYLQNDFVGTTDAGSDGKASSELKDMWVQHNGGDWMKIRVGQFKTPYSRQFLASDSSLQIMDRSLVTDLFDLDRQQGAMIHGGEDGINYYLGLFNGESDDEGRNRFPQDPDMQGVAMLTWSSENYGSRTMEGDINHTDDMGWTAGVSGAYGSGTSGGDDFDKLDANADVGMRMNGLSLQGEFFFSNLDFDVAGETDDMGFYAQIGYFFTDMIEGAFRFSLLEPDDDASDLDDAQEYMFGLGYYINGHNLKVLASAGFVEENVSEGDDLTDARYQLELTGYL